MADGSDPYGSQLAGELLGDVLERFLRYVRIDTQSDRAAAGYPSTAKQLDLIRLLADELRGLGLDDVEVTEHGYVFATSRASASTTGPPSASIAHVDTSPDAPGAGVDPQVWRDYDGGELGLPGDPAQVLSPAASPLLASASGTTSSPPTARRSSAPTTRPAWPRSWPPSPGCSPTPRCRAPARASRFTVDEEVGHGTDHFDLERFGADFAYTLDGQEVGEIENETFSAIELEVTLHRRRHPPRHARRAGS